MSRSRLVPLVGLLVACGPAAPTTDLTESFAGPYDQVVFQTDDGRVEFSVGEGDGVSFEFLPSTSDDYLVDDADGVLTVTAVCFGETEPGCHGGFLVTVPGGQSVRAQTDSGEVVFGAGLFGTLDAQTASGPISFEDLGSAEATVLTGTGEVRARFVEKPTSVSFDSGASLLSLQVPAGRYALDLDTTGQQTVQPEIVDGEGPPLRLHSGTGTIDLYATE